MKLNWIKFIFLLIEKHSQWNQVKVSDEKKKILINELNIIFKDDNKVEIDKIDEKVWFIFIFTCCPWLLLNYKFYSLLSKAKLVTNRITINDDLYYSYVSKPKNIDISKFYDLYLKLYKPENVSFRVFSFI